MPKPLLFIVPTLIGTPFIAWTVVRYQRQQEVGRFEGMDANVFSEKCKQATVPAAR